LQAGADMPLAQGSQAEQAATLAAIALALQEGRLNRLDLQASQQRLDLLALAYPVASRDYPSTQRVADDALMHKAWAASLSAIDGAEPPSTLQPMRVITQGQVVSTGVAEAGLSAAAVAHLFAGFADVDYVFIPDLRLLAASDLPQDKRLNVLVSNQRARYGKAAAAARPDLHLAIWNPFQVLDIDAPAVISWGYADGALAALKEWLAGRIEAKARPPVRLGG
jgi:beta-N-acetylhexosaminidase